MEIRKSPKKVAILEILRHTVSQNPLESYWARSFKRSYGAIMSQVVSVWCRQLGFDTSYHTYYCQADPLGLLPDSLDVLFVSAYTKSSLLAYAIAKHFQGTGTLTVVGGPHARGFPRDCLRFFDIVVEDCDKPLISDIVAGHYEPGCVVSSGGVLTDIPTVEERLPEIQQTNLSSGKRSPLVHVAMVTSLGCPYDCDFCVDWNRVYSPIPAQRLREDLDFVSRRFPGLPLMFHDPNFGVRFDEVLSVIESIPPARRSPYAVESTLSVLKPSRLRRLAESKCQYVAPGIESWTGKFSGKANAGQSGGVAKLRQVVDHFREMKAHIPGVQANVIFGTDCDAGPEPEELTVAFFEELPSVIPLISFPMPFGATPSQRRLLEDGRVLAQLPFCFYGLPFLAVKPLHYSVVELYDRMIRMYESTASLSKLWQRAVGMPRVSWAIGAAVYTLARRYLLAQMKGQRRRLADRVFRDFHEGETSELPEFYLVTARASLGRYQELLSDDDLTPDLRPIPETPTGRPWSWRSDSGPPTSLRSNISA